MLVSCFLPLHTLCLLPNLSHCPILMAWSTPIQSSRPISTISSSLEPSLTIHTEQMTSTFGFVPLLYLVHFYSCLYHSISQVLKCLPSLQNGELFKDKNHSCLMFVFPEPSTVPGKPQDSMRVC